MNWEAIGTISAIVGTIGVVLSVIYLARQVREARLLTNAQIEDSVLISWGNRILAIGESREKAELLARGLNDFDSLDQPDKFIFHTIMDSLYLEFHRQYHHFEENVYGWKTRNQTETSMVMLLISPGAAQWWEQSKPFYMHTEYMDKLIAEKRDDLPPMSDIPMLCVKKSVANT